VKQYLLMVYDRSLNQTIKLEATKAAAKTLMRVTVKQVPVGTLLPPTERCSDGQPACWQSGSAGRFSTDCRLRPDKVVADNQDWRRDFSRMNSEREVRDAYAIAVTPSA
jgi:hypothetical protein